MTTIIEGKNTVDATATRALRWLADAYEQAQRIRIETGERIRAVLQGRDETWSMPPTDDDPAMVLKAIATGDDLGPVPILGRTYRRHYEEEREMFKEMDRALRAHPVWPWLSRVKGIGPTLAGKMLARFDVEKAEHVSSFWAYAGLATVPAERYHCDTCGLVRAWPVGYNVTGKHSKLGSTTACKGTLIKVAGPDDGVRCAQPRPGRGSKAAYDQYAKKIMYLVGTSFLKSGGPYEEQYRRHRARLEVERPGWADGRKHLTALRHAEKLFLSHLWQVWREAVGLPVTEPYAEAELGHGGMIDPWSMVE